MKIIIYTCNVNNYDTRKKVVDVDANTQYLYYSDNMSMISGWKLMKADMSIHTDVKKISRYYKTHSHLLPKHDYSIWIDASFGLLHTDILKFVEKHLGKNDIACYYHGEDKVDRSCIYQEAAVCINRFPKQTMLILDQVNRYRNEGFPERFGLRSAGIVLRRNNDNVRKFNEMWWDEIVRGSHRDQLSQMYVSWKTGIDVGKMTGGTVYINELVKYHYHIHRMEALKNKTVHKKVK